MLKRNTSKYALFLLLYSYSTKMSNFEAFLKSLSCYFMNSNPEAIFDILSGYPIWLSWFAREEISKYILIHYIYIYQNILSFSILYFDTLSGTPLKRNPNFASKILSISKRNVLLTSVNLCWKEKYGKMFFWYQWLLWYCSHLFNQWPLCNHLSTRQGKCPFLRENAIFASICKIYKKGILKFFNLGPRSGCLFIVHHIWVIDYFLSIYPKSDYQIFRIQMDNGWMHALLFIIYNCTILSKIWNIITRSYYSWICCCTSVDF